MNDWILYGGFDEFNKEEDYLEDVVVYKKLINRLDNFLSKQYQQRQQPTNIFEELLQKTTPAEYYEPSQEQEQLLEQIRQQKIEENKHNQNPFNISPQDRLQTPEQNTDLIQELEEYFKKKKPQKKRKPKQTPETQKPRPPKRPGKFEEIHNLLEQIYGKGIFL